MGLFRGIFVYRRFYPLDIPVRIYPKKLKTESASIKYIGGVLRQGTTLDTSKLRHTYDNIDSLQTVQETTDTPDIGQKLCLTSRSHKGRHFSFKDMTTKELINRTTTYTGCSVEETCQENVGGRKVTEQRLDFQTNWRLSWKI